MQVLPTRFDSVICAFICLCAFVTRVNSAKMAESIEIPFC